VGQSLFVGASLLGRYATWRNPLPAKSVSLGEHSVIVVNGDLHVRRQLRVDVQPHENKVLRVKLDDH
jgi:hypothetical protein